MKKLLLIAAVSIAATSAHASKARLGALSGAKHLSDIQDVFLKPDQATVHGEWVTVEFGSTAGATSNAEGGFVRKSGDAAWGFYLGHTSSDLALIRAFASTGLTLAGGITTQENPFNVFYGMKSGDMSWGVGLYYTNSDKKSVKAKQSAAGLTGSMAMGALDAQVKLGLANTVSTENAGVDHKITGKTTIGLAAGYMMDSIYLFGSYDMGGAKGETGSTAVSDYDANIVQVGVVDTQKKDSVDFFYGASYKMTTIKQGTGTSTKAEQSVLPVLIGIEADAANWLTFRASITQNFLLGSNKADFAVAALGIPSTVAGTSAETDTIANNTVVAAGVGMKWNKFNVDGVLQGASANGGAFGLDAAGFLGKLSMTYMF